MDCDCDYDCLNCKYMDCINDVIKYQDMKECEERDKEISKMLGVRPHRSNDSTYKNTYRRMLKEKEEKIPRTRSVFDMGNEKLVEWFIQWRQRILHKGGTDSMNTQQMRAILKKQYNGALKWVDKVDNMSDSQVQAIYFRMLRDGKLASTR